MGENPIALRSKKKLMEAMEELLREKPYKDITVTELCRRAGLSRPAYYQNFGDTGGKDGVVKRLLYEKVVATAQDLSFNENLSSRELAEGYFQIVDANRDFMQILMENDLSGMIIEMCTLAFMDMPQSYGNLGDETDFYVKRFYSAFVSAGVSTILTSWMVNSCDLCEEDIIAVMEMALEGRPFRNEPAV